jgi:glutamate-5-semialdehyde dehydrogenase
MNATAFSIEQAAKNAKSAAKQTRLLSHAQKRDVLLAVASQIEAQQTVVLAANEKDMHNAAQAGLSDAMQDRLLLTAERLANLSAAVVAIANQPDPVGSSGATQTMPSGIRVNKMRIPLGVIAMIYESRPNVTIDAAALCFKAGNAVILRGGKEALHSNLALAACFHTALQEKGIAAEAVTVIPDPDRSIMQTLLTLNDSVDLIIPRGGEGLIRYVSENSRIPVIQHFNGVCHLLVDEYANQEKALAILENGKTQRTGVCNALETLLVDAAIADSFLPKVAELFSRHKVKVHACDRSIQFFDEAEPASIADWHAEYLAMEIAVRVVDDFKHGLAHIEEFSSDHTEVIVTESLSRSQAFVQQVSSAVVMVNASSRFSDGGELGLGAEIGISTSKLHAYGPMGADSLTTEKFVVTGTGEIRS